MLQRFRHSRRNSIDFFLIPVVDFLFFTSDTIIIIIFNTRISQLVTFSGGLIYCCMCVCVCQLRVVAERVQLRAVVRRVPSAVVGGAVHAQPEGAVAAGEGAAARHCPKRALERLQNTACTQRPAACASMVSTHILHR